MIKVKYRQAVWKSYRSIRSVFSHRKGQFDGFLGRNGKMQVVGHAAYCLAGTQAIQAIPIGYGLSAAGGADQVSAVIPTHGPAGAVVVAGGIANGVIGDRYSVQGRQQVLPICIAVGVGVGSRSVGSGFDVANRVIGIGLCW